MPRQAHLQQLHAKVGEHHTPEPQAPLCLHWTLKHLLAPCLTGGPKSNAAQSSTAALQGEDDIHAGFGVSPNRMLARAEAYRRMEQCAQRMQRTANRLDGGFGDILEVGTVVSINLQDVDRAKLDATCVTAVIVEVVPVGEKDMVKYRLASKAGTLKPLRSRCYIRPLPHVTPSVMGLEEALANWKELPEVSDRQCSRFISATGGQGLVHCLCRGKCDTLKCSCYKVGVECNSRCHKQNCRCVNKMK